MSDEPKLYRTNYKRVRIGVMWTDIGLAIIDGDAHRAIKNAASRHIDPTYTVWKEGLHPGLYQIVMRTSKHEGDYHTSFHIGPKGVEWVRRFERDPARCEPFHFSVSLPVQHIRGDESPWGEIR